MTGKTGMRFKGNPLWLPLIGKNCLFFIIIICKMVLFLRFGLICPGEQKILPLLSQVLHRNVNKDLLVNSALQAGKPALTGRKAAVFSVEITRELICMLMLWAVEQLQGKLLFVFTWKKWENSAARSSTACNNKCWINENSLRLFLPSAPKTKPHTRQCFSANDNES